MSWYGFFKVPFTQFVKHGYKATITGAENIPATGPVILASNHVSYADTFLTPALIKRQVTLPVKAEAFRRDQGPKWAVIGWFLKAVGMVPLDRTGGRAALDGLGPVIEALEQGRVVGIYPEGTRSPDGRLYKGKTGMARMALANDVPVIPVGISGSKSVKGPLGIPWARRPVVVIGKPMHFTAQAVTPGNSKVLRWVTDEVLAAIQQLTGQEYVDVYAARVKTGDLKDGGADAFVVPRPGGGAAPVIEGGGARASE